MCDNPASVCQAFARVDRAVTGANLKVFPASVAAKLDRLYTVTPDGENADNLRLARCE